MSRNALIVGQAGGPAEVVTSVLRRFGFVGTADVADVDAALEALRRGHYELVIVPLQDVGPAALAELDREIRKERYTFVIGTAPKPDPELILRAMRAGIHEFVVHPPDAAELAAAVDRLMRRVPAERQQGHVVAVYSSKGGLGTTSIAVNLAHGFARNHPRSRVALADLDVLDGGVRVYLDLDAAYHIGDLVAKLDRMDAELLDALLTPTEGGVWVLPGPDSPDVEDELDATATTAIVEHLRAHFAFTVLDCEHHLSERTLAAMDAADRILLVTQLNVAALKSAQKALAIFRRLGYRDEKLCVVVNREQGDDVLSRRDAAKVLTCEVFFGLPNDYQLSSHALTKGVPVGAVEPEAELARAYVRLAAKLGGADETPDADARGAAPGGESRLGRLLGRIRRT